ncbi:TPM domain-containing protein [Deminuibacter soli]|uniref:TPM domain-containing protein n=1 Tax=Deminuibacter soli TaxID=2291815 RepID=A0A3E1ND41_9BACT|nr:TPM domain-containing protein [Deminuibacter soli]RFM25734.1 TPM domain-containing protein [Deminuibacter soli]
MKYIFSLVLLVLMAGSICAQEVLPKPHPIRFVTDAAHVLSGDELNMLENMLRAVNDTSTNELVIVTIPTLQGAPIEDYTLKLFRSWGIGKKDKNNGILIFAAINDHKMRIEVGLGLEGALPDITARQILDNEMRPAFREGNYYAGFNNAVNAVIQSIAGEYTPSVQTEAASTDNDNIGLRVFVVICIIVVVLIILVAVIVARNPSGGRSRSSGWSSLSSSSDSSSIDSSWSSSSDSSSSSSDFGGGSSGGGGSSSDW